MNNIIKYMRIFAAKNDDNGIVLFKQMQPYNASSAYAHGQARRLMRFPKIRITYFFRQKCLILLQLNLLLYHENATTTF